MDILIITDERLSSDLVSKIRRMVDNTDKPVEVDLIFYTEDMFAASAMPLIRSVKQNNLVLYDRGEL